MNAELNAVHTELVKHNNALSKKLGKAKERATAQAILTEMQEINHRVIVVGGLLFAEESQRISKAAKGIEVASAKVTEAIADIHNIAAVVNAVSAFLGLVDEVIDTAKLVAKV